MSEIADEIRAAARQTGARVSESSMTSRDVMSTLAWRYSQGRMDVPLWEAVTQSEGVQDAEAWRWTAEYVTNQSCILAFDPEREQKAFVFANGAELEMVLRECSGFEFYVTGATFEYFLCFNHHDVLVAAGTAREWLRNRGVKGE